jgi:putative oxidoreductase
VDVIRIGFQKAILHLPAVSKWQIGAKRHISPDHLFQNSNSSRGVAFFIAASHRRDLYFDPSHQKKGVVMFRRLMSTSATWAMLPIRLGLGAIFIAHGSQKVLGSFNGPGLSKWTSMSQMAPFSFMRPSWLWLGAAALSELLGGALILIGFLTRLGAFLIICVMLTAIIGVHWPAFFSPGGFELALACLGGMLALLIAGGGQASADKLFSRSRRR